MLRSHQQAASDLAALFVDVGQMLNNSRLGKSYFAARGVNPHSKEVSVGDSSGDISIGVVGAIDDSVEVEVRTPRHFLFVVSIFFLKVSIVGLHFQKLIYFGHVDLKLQLRDDLLAFYPQQAEQYIAFEFAIG